MLKKMLAGAAATAFALGLGTAAHSATYISKLEYTSSAGPITPDFGTVTLDDGLDGGTRVRVTVDLTNALSLFVDTGANNHWSFNFNLFDGPDNDPTTPGDSNSSVSVVSPPSAAGWTYDGEGSYKVSGFTGGSNTSIHNFKNAFTCCGGQTGGANGVAPKLVFDVTNAAGITFAGVGATFDANNKLLSPGTGNAFRSTDLGWWFAADILNGSTGQTGEVAAKDAFLAVPEPASWALMILGFGSAGAMLRRRRAATA
jgi:hypothetical protein